MPEINNNNYNTWSKWLSQAWGNQDLSKDHYDYRKYYNDQPIVAWLQLNSILAHNWNKHIPTGHFLIKELQGLIKLNHMQLIQIQGINLGVKIIRYII